MCRCVSSHLFTWASSASDLTVSFPAECSGDPFRRRSIASRIACRSMVSCLDVGIAAFPIKVVSGNFLLKALYARSKTLADGLWSERASDFLT